MNIFKKNDVELTEEEKAQMKEERKQKVKEYAIKAGKVVLCGLAFVGGAVLVLAAMSGDDEESDASPEAIESGSPVEAEVVEDVVVEGTED